ncbi:hypothetical protein FACS189432_01570 [Bacteroidia bacterium]|nr:hypothetical protein FACS189426_01330 [Bacteroidia bacterium]GHT26680.1 hypothetical protein FACS189432_01570 [Bacteroidia bacterium]
MENKNIIPQASTSLLTTIVSLIDNARRKLAAAVNSELSILYWHIGKQINESVLKDGKGEYGKTVVKELSAELTRLYGRGFSAPNLYNFMRINELMPDEQIFYTLSRKLTWTHIRNLIYIEDDLKRDFYTQMCIYERWSVRKC